MNRRPPRLATLLLRLRFPRASAEFLLGDLIEEYNLDERSDRWYWRQALSLMWRKRATMPREPERRSPTGPFSGSWNHLPYPARKFRARPGMTAAPLPRIALRHRGNTGNFPALN